MTATTRRTFAWCTAALLGAACAEPPPPPAPAPAPEIVAPPAPPLDETRVVLRRNDTLGAVVQRAGLPAADAGALLTALNAAIDARRVRPGEALVVYTEPGGALAKATYESSPLDIVDVAREDGAFVAAKRELELVESVASVSVKIESSLWDAFVDAGEDPSLAVAASDVLAWELDFYRDVRSGDRIDLVVEKVTHDGALVRYGDLLAVRYTGEAGWTKEFFRHEHGGRAGYYTADGRSARRAFLKQPLPLVRITSRFGGRRHPTLGFWKKHEGVDYGAPTGTPVWAVGDGQVVHAGWKGANGILVSVRHSNGFTSHYAHLSRLGKGVRKGVRVSQKQVVGHVGSTGRSTGPHLHFGLSRGGKFVNPLNQNFPAAEPLAAAERDAFALAIVPLKAQLERGRLVATRE